jgi:aminoglycoside phosphotransferase (APT) family kinase protein
VAHYERRTGRTASNLWFYLAFNKFKSACITQGVYARFRGGVRGTQGADVEAMREAVFVMANAAKRMIGFAGLD